MRALLSLLTPGGLILALVMIVERTPSLAPYLGSVVPIVLAILWFIAMVVSWIFRQNRILFLSIILGLSWAVFLPGAQGAVSPLVVQIALVWVPVNVFLHLFFPQHGIFRPKSIAFLVFLALQVMVLSAGVALRAPSIETFLHKSHLALVILPRGGMVLWVFPLLLVMVRYLLEREPVDRGYIWTIPALWLGILRYPDLEKMALYGSTALFILLLAMLEKSYRLAYRDELTGLPTRRGLQDALKSVGSTYALAMVDIDHFKSVNDRYGHDVGDQVLKMVATRLQAVRGNGRAYRYGGEEFTIFFPGRTRKEVQDVLEELRKDVADNPFVVRGEGRPRRKPKNPLRGKRSALKDLKVTVSMGVSDSVGASSGPEEVLKVADTALYRAKKAGRNCIKYGRTS
ncbi:MAG TPA: GGDEF domain-containing protein [Thermoanaerobaculia bacterium]|mgnify:CR=1 FL=1|nr:GGDEF domain-containing protein [Thermoanaerobaculia bacterium]HUM30063.1 GGDEF domain-containing protein [Thermoanaerobaculia bacterium]HXK69441.1 GGDEF domain-containing protein [Thermoanaerobaculia bacterium]